jgi:hypothetical protein
MDIVESRGWAGRRVWIQSSSAKSRQYGEVMHVSPHALYCNDVYLGVRLEDGGITALRGSQKRKRWDFAD